MRSSALERYLSRSFTIEPRVAGSARNPKIRTYQSTRSTACVCKIGAENRVELRFDALYNARVCVATARLRKMLRPYRGFRICVSAREIQKVPPYTRYPLFEIDAKG